MSRSQLERARDLIKAKKYDEAREILLLSDHLQAARWLDQLDGLNPDGDLVEPNWSRLEQNNRPQKKYHALRIISDVYRFFGGVIILLAVIFGAVSIAFAFQSRFVVAAIIQGFGIILGGLISGIGVIAIAQLIQLLIDLEENTRRTNELLLRRD
jgi:hypothetical protein